LVVIASRYAPGSGGCPFTDVLVEIEIASALEGLSARWAAERGTSAAQLSSVRLHLAEIESLLGNGSVSAGGLARFALLNCAFHRSVADLACSTTLTRHTGPEPVDIFTRPEVRKLFLADPARISALLLIEQDEHHRIVEAIEAGRGARAESLVREHALLARRHLAGLVTRQARAIV
jgi:GntR family transcriptional regulator of vanillate catabolism